MDLRTSAPRSPYEKLGDMVWLPRLIDKARAHLAGTAGDYNCAPPMKMDSYFLKVLGLDRDAFLEAVKTHPDDREILAWVLAHRKPMTAEEVETFNQKFSRSAPKEASEWVPFYPHLEATLGKQGNPTWFQILDADEGRLPAQV